MRVLSDGPDHGCGGAAGKDSAALGRSDYAGNEWQHLPLRNVRSHPAGHTSRGGRGRCAMSAPVSAPAKAKGLAVSRREFIGIGLAAGTGLVVGFYLPHGFATGKDAFAPNAYLRIAPDGKITVMVARSEIGQGVRTALPMILAEELEADWKQIEIEQAGASTLFGDQSTGGSASVRTTWDPMRKAGAAAREMLISAAALEWGVARSSCAAENSSVVHSASGRRLNYGQLANRAATLPVPTDPPLKQAKDYKIVGKPLPRLDTASKVNGAAIFGSDFRVPNMKYALLARCPVIGGKVSSFDDKESRKIPGVSHVGKINDSSVGVVADSVWAAMEGRRVLNVGWDEGPNKNLN